MKAAKAGPVVIVSSPADVHALAVVAAVDDAGGEAVLFDTSRYPASIDVALSYGHGGSTIGVGPLPAAGDAASEAGMPAVAWPDVSGIWYRRFQPFGVPDAVRDQEVRNFCVNECREVFFSLLEMSPNVINRPSADAVAGRKPYQLARAAALGLDVPETLITNDPDKARQFWLDLDGEVIFKILSNTRTQFTQTRALGAAEIDQLPALRYAPAIFQRKLEPANHLRVTVVDQHVFAARLTTTRPEARYDWRLDRDVSIEAAGLSAATAGKIRTLMDDLGLRYGAIDFVVTADGREWFLEVNPSGQFLFVEIETGQPISRTIAESLLKGTPSEA